MLGTNRTILNKGMSYSILTFACVIASSATIGPVFAAVKEAESCAVSLNAQQKLIYAAVKPEVTAKTKLDALIRKKTMELYKQGRVQRSSAPTDAKVARRCLKMLQS
jgi:hypothetical protein